MALDADTFLAEAAEPVGPIRPLSNGLYEPASATGEGVIDFAFFYPVIDGPDLVDIVAWAWDDPAIWWQRAGRATLLGDHHLWRPNVASMVKEIMKRAGSTELADHDLAWQCATNVIANRWRPGRVLLVETPAAYIENRGECVCVLDWDSVDLIDAFHRGPTLVFASERLRRRFDQRWGEQVRQAARAAIPRYTVIE